MTTLASIGSMSKIEYCNCCLGYIEEIAMNGLHYRESLYGFTRQINFKVTNAWRCEPIIECGSYTPCAASSTVLTDSAADFLRQLVVPGDIVENLTDTCTMQNLVALWDVTNVTKTALCVRLNTGVPGGDDQFENGDTYNVRRKNSERVYKPNLTKIRLTNRCTCIVFFEGVVQDIDPQGDQARYLEVTAEGYDIQLRDATPANNAVVGGCIGSVVIKDIFDDKTDQNQLMFPLVAGDERSPGIEHSPNANIIEPDLADSQRAALPHLLDISASEFWTRTTITNRLCPDCITHNVLDCPPVVTELVCRAEGSLATRFETNCQFCLAVVELRLTKTELCATTLLGNVYVRIEGEEPTTGNPIPSGYLVSPWAESNLIALSGVCPCCNCCFQVFTFDDPVSLAKCTGYWIVLSYQENNNNYSAGITTLNWSLDTADAAACATDRSIASFACNVWTATPTDSFNFRVRRFSEAVWLYNVGSCAFICYTSHVTSDDACSMPLLSDCASSSDVGDRLYLGFAGPIRGLTFCYNVPSNTEYGTWKANYFGGHRAKIYGTITTSNSGTGGVCLILIDSTKNFRKVGIEAGDIVYNLSDNSVGIITVVTPCNCVNRLTVQDLFTNELACSASCKTFVIGDEYAVLGWQRILSGTSGCISCTTLTDACATFRDCGVRVGDLVVNITDNLVSFITSYNQTQIIVGCGTMSWAAGNTYSVYTRWRGINIRNINNTFIPPTCALKSVSFEWTIPADWCTLRFTSNAAVDLGPEAQDPSTSLGLSACTCHQRYWMVLQNTCIPTTEAQIDVLSALPGVGFGVKVGNIPRSTVICAYPCAVADACAPCGNTLRDISRDFFGDANTVGVFNGDIVENESASPPTVGCITAFSSSGAVGSQANDQLSITNTISAGQSYRLRRNQYPLEYFRLGTRPYKGATRYGLTLKDGTNGSCQMASLRDAKVSKSSRTATNRVCVTGKVVDACCNYTKIEQTLEDRRGQREFKRTVQKNIVDFAITECQDAINRGNAEIAKFIDAQERVCGVLFGWPTITKAVVRKTWFLPGLGADAQTRMDGDIPCTSWAVSATNANLVDSSINFKKWDIRPGDVAINLDKCDAEFVITGFCTTTNKNDTLVGSFTCCTTCWTSGNNYTILQNRLLEVGDLVRVRISDCVCTIYKSVDECYLVTMICYSEPSQDFKVRLQRNFSSSAVGDFKDEGELIGYMADQIKRMAQLSRSIV